MKNFLFVFAVLLIFASCTFGQDCSTGFCAVPQYQAVRQPIFNGAVRTNFESRRVARAMNVVAETPIAVMQTVTPVQTYSMPMQACETCVAPVQAVPVQAVPMQTMYMPVQVPYGANINWKCAMQAGFAAASAYQQCMNQ
jgi:hypothetical protein